MATVLFRKQWLAFLKEQGSMSKASSYSYKLWKEKYQSAKTVKPQELFAEKLLIPGKIYTCLYANMAELKSEAKFVDHWPVLFSMGQTIHNNIIYETGIDFNLVPQKVRPIIIEKLQFYFKTVITQNTKNINEGKKGKKKIGINFKLAQAILKGTGFERAYVTLRRDKMGKIKVYDYGDWVSVVPLYTQGVRGKSINKIYADYVKNMGQLPEEKQDFVNKLKK